MSNKIILKFIEKLTMLTRDGQLHWNKAENGFNYECSLDFLENSHRFTLTADGLHNYSFKWSEYGISVTTTNISVTKDDCKEDSDVMLNFCKAVSGSAEDLDRVNSFLSHFNISL